MCGRVDKSIPVPETTKTAKLLATCRFCGKQVMCLPTSKKSEASQLATVIEGESREEELARSYVKHEGGHSSRKLPGSSDIDREVLDVDGQVIYYLEMKERSNSINAYRDTMFTYTKIQEGKRLSKETGLSVHIVIKFKDCWARHLVDPSVEYVRGKEPFAPRYRKHQHNKRTQIPVLISVEDLQVLSWRVESGDNLDS
jgi:hypothetical protein